MRIRTICASALLTAALTFGAEMVCAQGWAPYSNQGPPPGYAAPGAPYGAPGYAPYGPPQAFPPNYPVYPVYPNYYPAGPQAYLPPGMVQGMPVSQIPPYGVPAYAVPFTGAPQGTPPQGTPPQGTPPAGMPPAATTPGEKIGPPAVKAAPETLPSVGEPFMDMGEPMIRFVGPNNPGVLPPLRNAVPERIDGERFWFSGGYLLSFMRSERYSTPLVTTGSTLDAHAAGIGQPSTTVLFGDPTDFGMFQGIRLGAGIYLGDGQYWSLEGSVFYYFPETAGFAANSDAGGRPIIARPIFDINRGFERAFVDSLPGTATGGAAITVRSQFEGGEAEIGYHYRLSDQFRLDGLFGFRYLRLSEDLTIQDRLTALRGGSIRFMGAPLNAGDMLTDSDNFQSTNQFYGLLLGGRAQWEYERLFANAFVKLGFGINDERVNISGLTARSGRGINQVANGGILALSSNSGAHSRTTFGFVPETGFDLGVRLTPHVRLTAGYSFLLWTQVARPGNQVNRNVNPTLVPSDNSFGTAGGTPAPVFTFNSETFWLHSFNFGLDFQF